MAKEVHQQSVTLASLESQLEGHPLAKSSSTTEETTDSLHLDDLSAIQEALRNQSSQLALIRRRIVSLAGWESSPDGVGTTSASLASLLAELKSQTQVLTNLDARMTRLEERVWLRVQGESGERTTGEGAGQGQIQGASGAFLGEFWGLWGPAKALRSQRPG